MPNITSRINKLEKKVIPETKTDLCNILLTVWEKEGKTYYQDKEGNEKEFIQTEHRETPILVYLTRGDTPLASL